jgi:hypothetical protein
MELTGMEVALESALGEWEGSESEGCGHYCRTYTGYMVL